MKESGRPGVMIYFDTRKALSRLSLEQKGVLFDAILDFAEFGTEPELDDLTGMCFDFIRPKIEWDAKKYTETVWKRKYAAYVREANRSGEVVRPFEDWYADNTGSSETGDGY